MGTKKPKQPTREGLAHAIRELRRYYAEETAGPPGREEVCGPIAWFVEKIADPKTSDAEIVSIIHMKLRRGLGMTAGAPAPPKEIPADGARPKKKGKPKTAAPS